jgi:hypothetical protein
VIGERRDATRISLTRWASGPSEVERRRGPFAAPARRARRAGPRRAGRFRERRRKAIPVSPATLSTLFLGAVGISAIIRPLDQLPASCLLGRMPETDNRTFTRGVFSEWKKAVTGEHSAPYWLAALVMAVLVPVLAWDHATKTWVKVLLAAGIPTALLFTSLFTQRGLAGSPAIPAPGSLAYRCGGRRSPTAHRRVRSSPTATRRRIPLRRSPSHRGRWS